jgi:SAM-dependent methyltransferase
MSNFNQYSRYYDLLYRDKDYQSEANYVLKSLKKYDADIFTMLELGSGSGGHAKYLSDEGIQITGIERSKDMVIEANAKCIANFNSIVGDITDFNLDKKFDAVISIFHVISYLTENKQLINCFKLANKHLKTNGLFLFDFWYTPAVLSLKPETRVKRLEDAKNSVIRIAESVCHHITNIVDVNFEIHVIDKETKELEILHETHPMRHFSLPEIDLLAKMTGFEIVNSEEFLTKNNPDDKTWGVCVVLKKTDYDTSL